MSGQPRVRRNEWGTLEVPALGAWQPRLSVSVVVPAWRAERLLPTVLAGLAAQTYPAHLLEVVVANDGPADLALPEVRPERTRVVRVEQGWGRANACHTGALASDGEVLHWLDADMLVEREHVEAQLRWHHVLDHAVALGHKWFVDPDPVLAMGPAAVREAVAAGTLAACFEGLPREGHDWVEAVHRRTDDLRAAGPRALRTHVGATGSLRRSLYDESGGMDCSLVLGEDIDLGHRLAECGAVFVPDLQARSWHLGRSHVMQQREQINAHNDPYLADRVPDLRPKRRPGRQYAVPYLEVVLDTDGRAHDAVIATIDSVLASTVDDLVVTLLGDWSTLTDDRRSPLADPLLDQRLVRASYLHDPRVRLLEQLPPGRCPAMFRLTLPDAGWAPGPKALSSLLMHLERTHHGLCEVVPPAGTPIRLERTAAVQRASKVARSGEDLDDVVGDLFGRWAVPAQEAGFEPSATIPRPRLPNTAGRALDPDEAWAQLTRRPRRPRTGEPPGPSGPSGPARESVRERVARRLRRR